MSLYWSFVLWLIVVNRDLISCDMLSMLCSSRSSWAAITFFSFMKFVSILESTLERLFSNKQTTLNCKHCHGSPEGFYNSHLFFSCNLDNSLFGFILIHSQCGILSIWSIFSFLFRTALNSADSTPVFISSEAFPSKFTNFLWMFAALSPAKSRNSMPTFLLRTLWKKDYG